MRERSGFVCCSFWRASGLLLLIACTNIANLFLARVASRASEFATRIALGAGRARILSQTLTETSVLAILGGTLGAVIAQYGAGLLAAHGPNDVRLLADTRLNLPVFLFAIAASLVTGIICGVFPAWQTYRKDASTSLQEGARTAFGGSRTARFRQLLVGVEMALGTALLTSAGLLLHSFVKVMRVDRGYQIERVLAVDLSLFGQRYSTGRAVWSSIANCPETFELFPASSRLERSAICPPPRDLRVPVERFFTRRTQTSKASYSRGPWR